MLYSGLMKNMPHSLAYTLTSNGQSTTNELSYEICAYLETSVGNEYQGQALNADFVWWLDEIDDNTEDNFNTAGTEGSKEAEQVTTTLTGDSTQIVMMCILLVGSGFLLLLLGMKRKQLIDGSSFELAVSQQKERKIRFLVGISTIVVLVIALAVTTFAYVQSLLEVEDNRFRTGEVSINFNDGVPIINDEDLLFEPGMTIVKDFLLRIAVPVTFTIKYILCWMMIVTSNFPAC